MAKHRKGIQVAEYSFTMDESLTAVHQSDVPDRRILDIDIHHWGAFGQKIADVAGYLASDNPRKSSAHFVAQDGYVYCIVSPASVAWHAGDWDENVNSIGIECHPEMTDGDIETVAELIGWLWHLYGPTNIRKHSDFIVTDCPGRWASMLSVLSQKAQAYYQKFQTGKGTEMTEEQARQLAAVYAAIFDGGTSMPEGKPLKDLVNDSFTEVRGELAALTKALTDAVASLPKAGA